MWVIFNDDECGRTVGSSGLWSRLYGLQQSNRLEVMGEGLHNCACGLMDSG